MSFPLGFDFRYFKERSRELGLIAGIIIAGIIY